MKQQLILGVVMSAMTISAHAYQNASAQNFSAEVLLGVANQDTDFGGGDRASGSSTSFGIRGAYTFNPNVAAELSYQYYGSYDDSWQDEFGWRSEEHTSELQSRGHLVCRLLLDKKRKRQDTACTLLCRDTG